MYRFIDRFMVVFIGFETISVIFGRALGSMMGDHRLVILLFVRCVFAAVAT